MTGLGRGSAHMNPMPQNSTQNQSPAPGGTSTPICFLCGQPGPATGIHLGPVGVLLAAQALSVASVQEAAGIKAATHPHCWDASGLEQWITGEESDDE